MKKQFIYGVAVALLLIAVVFLVSCTGDKDGATSTVTMSTIAGDTTFAEGTTLPKETSVTVDASNVSSTVADSGDKTTSSGKTPKPSNPSLTEVPVMQTENNSTTSRKNPTTATSASSGGIEVQTGDVDEGWF